jgi:hypothetical protein
LGNIGLSVTALFFALGVFVSMRYQLKQDVFRASTAQFVTAGVISLALIVQAFLFSRRSDATGVTAVPNPWLAGAVALVAGSAVLVLPQSWGWGAAVGILVVDVAMFAIAVIWSKRSGWGMLHKLALASGAALAYGWHAFIAKPVVKASMTEFRIGNAVFLLAAIALIAFAARRIRAWEGARLSAAG